MKVSFTMEAWEMVGDGKSSYSLQTVAAEEVLD